VPTGPRPTTVPPLPTRTPSPTPATPIARPAPTAPAPVAAAPAPVASAPVASAPVASGGPAGNGSTPAPVPATGNGSTPAPVPATGNGNGSAPVAAEASAEITSSGLVKRVPRRSGGNRAVPGSDGPTRGPTTTSSRSPDEVRAMLSRFHSGKQAGQAPPTGSSPTPEPYPSDTHPSDRKET